MTVRRTLFLGLFLLVCTPSLLAQARFGIAGGINFANFNDLNVSRDGLNATTTLDNSTGYHIGAFVDIGAGPFSVRPGIFYVKAGDVRSLFLDSTGAAIPGEDASLDVTYISIPLDLRYRLLMPVATPYALFGPELRVQLGDAGTSLDDRVQSVGVALGFGAGVELKAPFIGPSFFIEARYSFDASGMTKAVEVELPASVGGGSVPLEEYKVSPILLRVGVSF